MSSYRLQQKPEFSGMAGMPFVAGLRRILTGLGISDKIIQRILRQANVAVTQNCYIKTVDSGRRGGDAAI
jgi:hypothetical protein